MGLVLPGRCALLDWLLKPLKSVTALKFHQIDGNNQYVPVALFNFQKLFTLFSSSSSHSHLSPAPQVEEASLSHIVDLLSLILLAAIWAVCPRDSLALLGQWVQGKLSQVRPRMLPVFSAKHKVLNFTQLRGHFHTDKITQLYHTAYVIVLPTVSGVLLYFNEKFDFQSL